MKKKVLLFIILCGLWSSFPVSSQVIAYYYDEAGNRVERRVIELSRAHTRSSSDNKPMEEKLGDGTLLIYPNPTRGVIEAAMSDGSKVIEEASVSNMQGQIIVRNSGSATRYRFDLSAHPDGVYLLKVKYGQTSKEFKIIKK